MKYYEMLCVLPGTLAEAELAPAVEQVSQTLGSYDAANVTLEDMGKSRLAYPIKHIRYGYFQLFRFELEADKLAKLENSVRLLGTLLRVVIRVTDPSNTEHYTLAQDPTALSAPPREERGDRRGRRGTRDENREAQKEKTDDAVESKEEKAPVVSDEKTSVETVAEPQEKAEETTPAKPEEKTETPKEEAPVVSEKKETKKEDKKPKDKKISIDDIDKKLDEILQKDIDTV